MENIGNNIGQTVNLLEDTIKQANENVARLKVVSEDTLSTNSQVQSMQQAIGGIESLMNDQERAIAGINAAVGNLLALSADTNKQTEFLDGLAGKLNGEAAELSQSVDKFKL